jgi:hypothetical protein
MKKQFTLLMALMLAGATTQAQPKQINRNAGANQVNLKSLKAVPVEPAVQQSAKVTLNKRPTPPRTSSVDIVPLGTSLNPYHLIGGARPLVSANAQLNTVTFIRRGGPDNGTVPSVFGSQYYYDLSTNGGSTFSLSRGPVYDPSIRPGSPANGRYPQGVIYNPPGNNTPGNAYLVFTGAVLDGTNGASWGGLGYGIHKLDNSAPPVYKLLSSNGRFNYLISNSITALPNGKVITVEENLPNGGAGTDDSLIVTTLNITTTPLDIVANPNKVAFPSFEGNMARPKVAFTPNGQIGYIATVGAPADNSETKQVYVPMYIKTTDGGATWSAPRSIPLNPVSIPDDDYVSPTFSRVKQQLLGGDGDYIEFSDQPGVELRAFFSTAFEFDINVDAQGNLHFLTPFMVGGWEGQEPAFSVYPGIGAVMTDVYMVGNEVIFRPLKTLNFWRGCFGDCPSGANRIVEANRPSVARSGDGTKMFFGWFDSDTALVGKPANTANSNLFPDYYICGVDLAANPHRWSVTADLTGSSAAYGLLFLGTFANTALNGSNNTFVLPVTYAATAEEILPDGSNLAALTTENYYLSGLVAPPFTITSNQESFVSQNLKVKLYPNPVQNKLNVVTTGKLGAPVKITIVNSLGQVVKTSSQTPLHASQTIEVDTQDLAPGMYNCRVETLGKTKVTKFVKQ